MKTEIFDSISLSCYRMRVKLLHAIYIEKNKLMEKNRLMEKNKMISSKKHITKHKQIDLKVQR